MFICKKGFDLDPHGQCGLRGAEEDSLSRSPKLTPLVRLAAMFVCDPFLEFRDCACRRTPRFKQAEMRSEELSKTELYVAKQ